MKSYFTFKLLLATFLLIITKTLNADEDLNGVAVLKGQTDTLEASFMQIEQKFATAVLSHNGTAFNETLSDIRQAKAKLYQTTGGHSQGNIHSPLYAVIVRMEVEGYRVKAEKINAALNWIAHEILGYQAGISELVHRLYAESIEIVIKLQVGRYDHLTKNALEVQKEISSLLTKLNNGTGNATFQEVEKIRSGLQLVIDDSVAIKSTIALQYESVRETLEYQSTEISLAQRYSVERMIAEMGNLVHYTEHYRELIVKVLTEK